VAASGSAQDGRRPPLIAFEIGVIADDLTGDFASSARLRRAGLRPAVIWSRDRAPLSADAVVCDMRTRDFGESVRDSAMEWAAWLCRVGCDRLELRFDRSLRGRPAMELDGVLAGWPAPDPLVVAVPAFPGAGRFTVEGCQTFAGQPGEAVPVADRLFPGDRTHRVGIELVREGSSAIADGIAEAARTGARRFVVDSTEERDLVATAGAVATLEDGGVHVVTMSPGAWLAYHPARRRRARPFVLVVIGSPTRENAAQLGELMSTAPGACTVRADAGPGMGTIDWERVAECRVVVVETISGGARDEGAAGHAELAARAAESVLMEAAGRGLSCRAVVATGGHTAASLVEALGATAIDPWDEMEPLVPRGVLSGGPWHGLEIATKGGMIGSTATLRTVVGHFLGGV
jgi:uncharacterized protein YgbK (DUF1537 family)